MIEVHKLTSFKACKIATAVTFMIGKEKRLIEPAYKFDIRSTTKTPLPIRRNLFVPAWSFSFFAHCSPGLNPRLEMWCLVKNYDLLYDLLYYLDTGTRSQNKLRE